MTEERILEELRRMLKQADQDAHRAAVFLGSILHPKVKEIREGADK